MTIDIAEYRISLSFYEQASFDEVGQLPVDSNSGAYSDVRVIASLFSAIPSLALPPLPAQTSGAIHFLHCTLRGQCLCFHSRVVVGCLAPMAQPISPPFPSPASPYQAPRYRHLCATAHTPPALFTSQIYSFAPIPGRITSPSIMKAY